METLVYFLILGVLVKLQGAKTPAKFLLLIYSVSLVGAILINNKYEVMTVVDWVNVIYMWAVIGILVVSWARVKYRRPIIVSSDLRLRRAARFLLALNGMIFIVLTICVFYSFSNVTDYSAFKNDDGAASFFKTVPINNAIILLSLYLHPTAYFLLPLHFYFICIGEKKNSYLCLLFSLNIILSGLMVFSRSAFLNFIFLYLFYLPFFYWRFDGKTKTGVHYLLGGVLVILVYVFYEITANRFVNELLYLGGGEGNIFTSNPIVYSLIDYASQWHANGIKVMAGYSFDILFGQLSFPLVILIFDKIGLLNYPSGNVEMVLSKIWGAQYDRFNGISANLLFDFGYVGALIFIFGYFFLVRYLTRTRSGGYPVGGFLVIGVAFVLAATGIFNYEMKSIYYNLALIYSCVLLVYLNKKIVL